MTDLTNYNWETHKEEPIPGTEDWQHVVTLGDAGASYEWTTLAAYYSPSARRYFWLGGSGCSCNSWYDDATSVEAFENGDRDALVRAVKSFADDHEYSFPGSEASETLATIKTFKEPK